MVTDGSFFIGKNEGVEDLVLNPDPLLKLYPEIYNPRFEAIAELRGMDDGSLHRGSEFRRIASFVNIPLTQGMNLLDPDFMRDRRRFYAFLRRNRMYATYDIKSHTVSPRNTMTVIDGKVV